eukprot:scaffold15391_cov146-Isochrysis_galbana.AAC.1
MRLRRFAPVARSAYRASAAPFDRSPLQPSTSPSAASISKDSQLNLSIQIWAWKRQPPKSVVYTQYRLANASNPATPKLPSSKLNERPEATSNNKSTDPQLTSDKQHHGGAMRDDATVGATHAHAAAAPRRTACTGRPTHTHAHARDQPRDDSKLSCA